MQSFTTLALFSLQYRRVISTLPMVTQLQVTEQSYFPKIIEIGTANRDNEQEWGPKRENERIYLGVRCIAAIDSGCQGDEPNSVG
jgi:hypothetical protein